MRPGRATRRGRGRGWFPLSLRTRLLILFIALAVIPCLTLTLVISERLARSIEFWGNPGVERTVDSSVGAARVALRALKDHLLSAVEGMAEGQAAPGGLDVLRIYERTGGSYALRQAEAGAAGLLITPEEIEAALDASRVIEKPEGFLLAIAAMDSAALRVIVGGYAIPPELFAQIAEARRGASLFDRLKLYLAVSKGWVWISTGFVALLVVVAAVVLARFMARGLTRPIEDLVGAMERLGRGEPVPTLAESGDPEMAYLVASFNRMAAELERSRRELRRAERLAAWQDVARRVAHEIKNPLTPIQFAIHRLKKELGEPGAAAAGTGRPAALHESLDAILGEVESLRHIAEEFSRLAKLPAPELAPIEIAPLLREAIELYASPAVHVRLELAPDLPAVEADRRLLRQVFTNLFKNAIEAMPGGGELGVRARAVTLAGGGPGLAIEITDSGPGIPAEILERMGEPYISTKKGGSGIGLAVVTKIVHDHRGRFELENGAAGGAVARVILPASRDRQEPARDPAARRAARVALGAAIGVFAALTLAGKPALADEAVRAGEPAPVDEAALATEPVAVETNAEPIAAVLRGLLPADWEITAASSQRAPSRWVGPANATYFRIEDTAVNVHHPDGRIYHPFIKLFFCPRSWSGEMEETDYYGDVAPAFLLGRNQDFTVFYQSGGHLTWEDPWAALAAAFELAPPRVGRELRLEVDTQVRRRLVERLAAVRTDLAPDALDRVVGLLKNGSLVYVEYSARVQSPPPNPGAPPLAAGVKSLIARETELLLAETFRLYPELESAYVRRLCDNRLFDALVERPVNGSALRLKGGAPAGRDGS